jgi:hypothetical protein
MRRRWSILTIFSAGAWAATPGHAELRSGVCAEWGDGFSPEWTTALAMERLEKAGVRQVATAGSQVALDQIATLGMPTVALQAVADRALAKGDATVFHCASRKADGTFLPVLLRFAGEVVQVSWGPAWRWPEPPTREALLHEFQLGGIEDGRATWDGTRLRALQAALLQLRPEERQVVAGLSFVMHDVAVTPDAGQYHGEDRSIHIFESAFHEEEAWIGSPRAPLPQAVGVLLHEIGHAFADYAQARARSSSDVLRQCRSSPLDDPAVRIKVAEACGGVPIDLCVPTLEARTAAGVETPYLTPDDMPTLQRWCQEHQSVLAATRALYPWERSLASWAEKDPVLDAYGTLPGAHEGPTAYGSTNLGESFAEAFALCHVDHAELHRVAPEIADWFDAGKHVEAVEVALAELSPIEVRESPCRNQPQPGCDDKRPTAEAPVDDASKLRD